MSDMRAKMRVSQAMPIFNNEGTEKIAEKLYFYAVCASTYPEDGTDENNTFAKFTPNAMIELYCQNPALFDKFKPDEEYYVDFSKV